MLPDGSRKMGMEHAIEIAKKMASRLSALAEWAASGAISYFVRRAAHPGLIGLQYLSVRSYGRAVWRGGYFYGTNPLAFAAPGEATTSLPSIYFPHVQAGKSPRCTVL